MYVSANQWVHEIIREGDVAPCCRHQHILVYGVLELRNCYSKGGWTISNKSSLQMVSGTIKTVEPESPLAGVMMCIMCRCGQEALSAFVCRSDGEIHFF